jgi:hypothetical protein
MWESNNLDGAAGDEPAGPEPDRAAEPQPAVPWTGPVLQGVSTPRVFSALASAAGTPMPNGTNGAASHEREEEEEEDGPQHPLEEGDVEVDGQIWSAEAAAARRRAQMRWREINPGTLLPSLTLSPEEAAALLPPAEQPAEPQPAVVEPPRIAPWLPATRPEPAPSASVPVSPGFGPVGRRRSPATVVLLSVITLGFYAVWWHHRVNREMAEFDPRMDVDPGMSTWAVALPLIVGWLVAAAAGARYLLALSGTPTSDLPISATQSLFLAFAPLVVPYLILLLPFSAAAVLMTHERARVVEDRVDTPISRQHQPVTALGWLTVPVVGGLVGMARMQQHLNEVWRAAAP